MTKNIEETIRRASHMVEYDKEIRNRYKNDPETIKIWNKIAIKSNISTRKVIKIAKNRQKYKEIMDLYFLFMGRP